MIRSLLKFSIRYQMGRALYVARMRSALSLLYVANSLKIPQDTLSEYETGLRDVVMSHAFKLSTLYIKRSAKNVSLKDEFDYLVLSTLSAVRESKTSRRKAIRLGILTSFKILYYYPLILSLRLRLRARLIMHWCIKGTLKDVVVIYLKTTRSNLQHRISDRMRYGSSTEPAMELEYFEPARKTIPPQAELP